MTEIYWLSAEFPNSTTVIVEAKYKNEYFNVLLEMLEIADENV